MPCYHKLDIKKDKFFLPSSFLSATKQSQHPIKETSDRRWKIHGFWGASAEWVPPFLGLKSLSKSMFSSKNTYRGRGSCSIDKVLREKEVPKFIGRPTPIPTPQPMPKPVNTWPTFKVNGFCILIRWVGLVWLLTAMAVVLASLPLLPSIPQQALLYLSRSLKLKATTLLSLKKLHCPSLSKNQRVHSHSLSPSLPLWNSFGSESFHLFA